MSSRRRRAYTRSALLLGLVAFLVDATGPPKISPHNYTTTDHLYAASEAVLEQIRSKAVPNENQNVNAESPSAKHQPPFGTGAALPEEEEERETTLVEETVSEEEEEEPQHVRLEQEHENAPAPGNWHEAAAADRTERGNVEKEETDDNYDETTLNIEPATVAPPPPQEQQQRLETDDLMQNQQDIGTKEPAATAPKMQQQEQQAELPPFDEFEYFDDRTLLDLFGTYAKEYLTTKVIPPTDPMCRWDWRSLKCEPSCHCQRTYQQGDYHLGRSCRLRSKALDVCEPTVYLRDRPAPKRILSLATQTTDIVKFKIGSLLQSVKRSTTSRYSNLQSHVCRNVARHLEEEGCWNTVPNFSIPEKIFCPTNDIQVCENAPIATLAFQQRREKIFADLYEKDF